MPEELRIDEDLQIVRITATGDVTAEDQKAMHAQLAEVVRDRGLDKLIVDGTRATSFPDPVALFDHGQRHIEVIREVWTAVIIPPDSDIDLRFLEDVIINRGGYMRIFPSECKALAWLKAKSGH